MGKKGGRNKLKRISAPRTWDIQRKERRFITKPSPGPHTLDNSYPLSAVLRDKLGLVASQREANYVITRGDILVDGVARRDPGFPVGLFDVVQVPKEGTAYRLVPSPDGLVTTTVEGEDAALKLCRVKSKVKVKGGHIQFGFHDGRSLLDDKLAASCGDSVVMRVPQQAIVNTLKLAKGTLGLVISGERAGQLGKISDVKKGTITREKMVTISLPSGETELPSRLVLAVGTDRPVLEVEAAS